MRSCVESGRMGPTGITGLPCEPRTSSGISADPRRRRPFSTAWPQRQNPRRSAPSVAVEACAEAVAARWETAVEKAWAALSSPTVHDFHAMLASSALTMAQGALGKIDDITHLAAESIDRAISSSQASPMRFWYAAVHARACRLTGRIEECVRSAEQLADSAPDVPGVAAANLAFLLGHAELDPDGWSASARGPNVSPWPRPVFD
jgi:hypothetical protein